MSNQQVFVGKADGIDLSGAIEDALKKLGGGSCDIKTVRIVSIDVEWGGLVPQAVNTIAKAIIVDGKEGEAKASRTFGERPSPDLPGPGTPGNVNNGPR